jgi:hypothetical protein
MQTFDPTITRPESDITGPSVPAPDRSRIGVTPALVPGWVIGVAWAVAYVVVGAVAPAADPNVQYTALDIALANLLLAGMALTVAGLTVRSVLAGAGAVLGGGVFAFGSITCWMTGHVGTWIAVQFTAGLALALLGAVALVSTRR